MDSAGRTPRGIVRINGTQCQWVEWEVEQNSYYSADTFRVTVLPDPVLTENYYAQQTSLEVEILGGFPIDPNSYTDKDLTSLIIGRVDEVNFDPVNGVFELHGRDLTSLFIDTKTSEKYQNHKASQIVTELAQRHGLDYKVAATGTVAGAYYEIDHVQLSDQRTEWDLLTFLAFQENFDIFVRGRTVYFQPKPTDNNAAIIQLDYTPRAADGTPPMFGGERITFSRNLTVAKGVYVTVRSFNPKTKKTVNGYFPKAARGATPGNAKTPGNAQGYFFNIPNLTQEQATARAIAEHKAITAHEMKMHYSGPGDVTMGVFNQLRLVGTGTAFDQIYFPDTIRRTMSVGEGFTMEVQAKNHNVNNYPAL